MAVLLAAPFSFFTDDNGLPLAGGKLYSYQAGTTTPKDTYVDSAGVTPNTNPVIFDASGRNEVWISGNYKFTLTDANDVLIRTVDNISAVDAGGDMKSSIYDPANIQQQVVGISAVQTITNKTLLNTASLAFNGTAGIIGTTTNNNADAGSVGEVLSAVNAGGVVMISGTPITITSVALTAGDWDISGQIVFQPAATTSVTRLQGGTNDTTNVLPGTLDVTNAIFQQTFAAFVPNSAITYPLNTVRKSLASTTTVYLVGNASFTVSTMSGFGYIRARRVR